MPELGIQTVRVEQGSQLTRHGSVVGIFRVVFMVGEHGPFSVEFLPADFTPDRVRAAQEEIAATIRKL